MNSRIPILICLTVAAMALLGGFGARCLGGPQRTVPPSGSDYDSRVHRTNNFVVISEGHSATSPAVGGLLEAIRVRLLATMTSYGLSPGETTEPLVWKCFDDREKYRRYALATERADAVFPQAYYSTRTNRVVWFHDGLLDIWPAAGREAASSRQAGGRSAVTRIDAEHLLLLTHEMAHQLAYNSGLQKRGVMYPLWVSEGVATYFESCALPQADRSAHDSRKRRLAQLASDGGLLPFGALVTLAGSEALEFSLVDVYAQCWGLMSFLLEHYPNQLSSYLQDLAQLPVGRRSSASLRREFVAHFGRIDSLERHWREYVASLSPPEPDPLTGRAVAAEAGL